MDFCMLDGPTNQILHTELNKYRRMTFLIDLVFLALCLAGYGMHGGWKDKSFEEISFPWIYSVRIWGKPTVKIYNFSRSLDFSTKIMLVEFCTALQYQNFQSLKYFASYKKLMVLTCCQFLPIYSRLNMSQKWYEDTQFFDNFQNILPKSCS